MNDPTKIDLPPNSAGEPEHRLWQLWRQGEKPDVHAFLASAGALSLEQLAAVLRVDQGERWQKGERIPVEVYLERYPALSAQGEHAFELVFGEFLLREELGEQPAAAEYLERFPQYAVRLRKQLEVHHEMGADLRQLDPGESRTLPAERTVSSGPRLPEIPGHDVLGELGRGGMGIVYKAWQWGLNRIVALKVLRPGREAGPDERARFRREAEAVGRMQHPHIVQIHEVGEKDGCPYFTMEFMEGGSLSHWLAGNPLAARPAAQLLETIARATHYAHSRGIIHRDLKPANILLVGGGVVSGEWSGDSPLTTPKISDFGLAKVLAGGGGDPTQTGAVLGTPSYMAPEQADGKNQETGPAADVYSLGAILYELLVGRPPFKAASAMETLGLVLYTEPLPPRRLQPKLPRDLETICLKCLAKDPKKRYGSAEALADDLRRFQAGEPIVARPTSLGEQAVKWTRRHPAVAVLTVLVTIVTILGLGGVLWQWWEAETARGLAANRADAAERAREKAEQAQQAEAEQRRRAETTLYFNRIALAERMWAANNIGRAEQLLDLCGPERRGWEWDYLKRLCHMDLATLEHRYGILSVVVSPDGRLLATAGYAPYMTLRDAGTGRELRTLQGHKDNVGGLAFSPDSKRLASASRDKTMKIWEVSTGRELLTCSGHREGVTSVAYSADGERLVSGGAEGTVKIWHAATAREEFTLRDQAYKVNSVAFGPDGKTVASAQGAGLVIVWDLATRKPRFTFRHKVSALAVAYSPDGSRLGSAGWDNVAHIWDLSTGRLHRSLVGHKNGVTGVAFLGSRRLATSSWDCTVKIWDLEDTTASPGTFRGHKDPVMTVAFSPDGRRLLSGGEDGTIKIWDVRSDPDTHVLRRQPMGVTSVAISSDGKRFAMADWEGVVKICSIASGEVLLTLSGHTSAVERVAFSRDGRYVASAGEDRTIRVWDAAGGKQLLRLDRLEAPAKDVTFSPDGRWLASVSGRAVQVWSVPDGQARFTGHHETLALSVVFSPNGQWLASTSGDGSRPSEIKIWDALTGRAIHTLPGDRPSIARAAFSPDSQRLATTGFDKSIRIWDVDTGRSLQTLVGHTDWVHDLSFHPNGRRLASASTDQTVKIWDLDTNQETLTLYGHTDAVYGVAFSPDGRRLLSACEDGTVRLWDGTPLDAAGSVNR